MMIYKHSLNEARRSGELDEYNDSMKENIACRYAIDDNTAKCFKDNHLSSTGAKTVIAEFGYDRTMWVLAATIRCLSHDGRFSIENKAWARKMIPDYLPEKDMQDYVVSSHPTLIDGFTDQVRHEYARLGLLTVKSCLEKSIGDNYENKLLVLKPDILKAQFKTPVCQYFFAQTGFGCYPDKLGGKVFGEFLCDGERAQFRRNDFLGIADKARLPEWANTRYSDLLAPKMNIRIFQLKAQADNKFMSYEFTEGHGGVNAENYIQIWGGPMVSSGLDDIFKKCNTDEKPLGYCGHSLSVSDIVEICDGTDKGFYYVDPFGFKKLDDFDIDLTDHSEMYSVLILENDKMPYTAEVRHELHSMQHIVGGHIEPVYFEDDSAICWCNEEFLLNGSKPNRIIGQTLIHGTCFISGDGYDANGEREWQSLTDEQVKIFTEKFRTSVILKEEQSEDESEDMSESEEISMDQ